MKTPEQILPLEMAAFPDGYSGSMVSYDLSIQKMNEYADQFKPIPVEKELPPIGKRILIFTTMGVVISVFFQACSMNR